MNKYIDTLRKMKEEVCDLYEWCDECPFDSDEISCGDLENVKYQQFIVETYNKKINGDLRVPSETLYDAHINDSIQVTVDELMKIFK